MQDAWTHAALAGFQAAVLGVICRTVHRLGEHVLLDRALWAVAIGSAFGTGAGAPFWLVLPAAGAAYVLWVAKRHVTLVALLMLAGGAGRWTAALDLPALALTLPSGGAPTTALLFLAGLKGGLLTFGGAYTAIPYVRADTVGRGWLSDAAFLDGVGLAHVIPAPLVIFATFAGWASGGLAGALAITAGMLLPAFALSLLFHERLETVLEDARFRAFLTGVAASVVGVIAVTMIELALGAATRSPNLLVSLALFLGALAILYRSHTRFAPVAVLVMGALGGVQLLR